MPNGQCKPSAVLHCRGILVFFAPVGVCASGGAEGASEPLEAGELAFHSSDSRVFTDQGSRREVERFVYILRSDADSNRHYVGLTGPQAYVDTSTVRPVDCQQL